MCNRQTDNVGLSDSERDRHPALLFGSRWSSPSFGLILLPSFISFSPSSPRSPIFPRSDPGSLRYPLLLSFPFMSIVLCAPLHLSPSTPLSSAFICSWPADRRPLIRRSAASPIFCPALPLVSSFSVYSSLTRFGFRPSDVASLLQGRNKSAEGHDLCRAAHRPAVLTSGWC